MTEGVATDDRPTGVDAFCGAGGMSLGLTRAGFRVGAAFDVVANAVAAYRRNLGDHVFRCDIREVTPAMLLAAARVPHGSIALVAGGPPCQGFSVQRRNGESDPRNSLPFAFLTLIKGLRPPFFLFENVPGIRKRHGEAILSAFLQDAEAAGYLCHTRLLDAVDYGVPQYRKRIFVVGELRDDRGAWFEFPKPTTDENSEATKVRAALAGLPSPPEDYSEHPAFPHHRRTRLSPLNLRRLAHVPQGGGMEDLPVRLRVKCHREGAARIGHRYVYGRLHWEQPAATITARFDSFTRGKFAHPLEDRNITLREGARLQTFPDDFVFTGSQEAVAAQIGNAVPPRLALILGLAIKDALERRRAGRPPIRPGPPLRQGRLFG